MRRKNQAGDEVQISANSLPLRNHKQLAKAISLARRTFGERLTVEQLAAKSSLSSRHLARLFAKEMQMRPAQFLETLRIRTAMERLEKTDDSVAKVAKDCGFGSRASLYRSFDRLVHMSPAEYRARHAKPSAPESNPTEMTKGQSDDQEELQREPMEVVAV